MKSPAYWHPALYHFFVRYVWRRERKILLETSEAVLKWIPDNASVCEVAAGTSFFYRNCLKKKIHKYHATDINPSFVNYLKGQGIDAELADIRTSEVQSYDIYIIVQALYNFKDCAKEVIRKLVAASNIFVIIVEPVDKPLDKYYWRDKLRAKLVDIGEGPIYSRFCSNELLHICNEISTIEYSEMLPHNQLLIVMKGKN